MQKELFAKLMKFMASDSKMFDLEVIVREYATPAQTKVMDGTKSAGDKPVSKDNDARKIAKDTLVKTVSLTGYGHKAAAEQDAQQMLHPNVYAYRTALFPNPQAHGVQVTITKATPVECKKFVNPMYKWGIDLDLEVSGPEAKAKTWLAAFENKVRVTNK